MQNSGIYKITSPSNKIYIGQAEDLNKREINYKRVYSVKNQIRIYRSIKKYGWEAHKFEIIEYCPIENLNERERYWQEYYDVLGPNGLNCLLKNTNSKRQKMSKETIEKIRRGNKGKKLTEKHKLIISKTHKGKVLSKDTIEKIRQVHIGKKRSEETRKNMSEASKGRKMPDKTREAILLSLLGKPCSQEKKDKISKGNKGKKRTPEMVEKMSKPVIQMDLEGNFIKEWKSIWEASRSLNLSQGNISTCCLQPNKRKQTGGFKWKFKEISVNNEL